MESLIENIGRRSRCLISNTRDIENSIREAMSFNLVPATAVERRVFQRVAYSQLFPLVPVDSAEDMQVCGEMIYVAGKNLSPGGIGFFHHQPVPSRSVVISLQHSSQKWCNYLVRISWCRFLHPGWYDSGGQITRMVEWCE